MLAVPSCMHSCFARVCAQADEPLATFMDYCTYGHMIDNVVLIVTGTLHERDVQVCTCLSCMTRPSPCALGLPKRIRHVAAWLAVT